MSNRTKRERSEWYDDIMDPGDRYGWALDHLYTGYRDGDFDAFVACACEDCDTLEGPDYPMPEWRR